jgi:glycine/D-amino acid oxidase-like deaminating enzyme
LTRAWLTAAERRGAEIRYGVEVAGLVVANGRCAAVQTADGSLAAERVVVAAGAWTRSLLRRTGHDVPVLHTHAEILETAPLPPTLSHFVGVADPVRAELELAMAAPELRARWDDGVETEILPPAVQFGVVQFADGRLRLGQISRAIPGFLGRPRQDGEAAIRSVARSIFPTLADVPATLRGCPVAISADRRPIAGPLAELPNVYVAAGYDSPLSYAPALAERLAIALTGGPTVALAPFSPDRFAR